MKTLKSFPGGAMASCLSLMAAAALLPATPTQAATWGSTDASFFGFWGFSDNWAVFELGNQNVQIQSQSLVTGVNALTLQGNGDTVDATQINPTSTTGAGDIGVAGGPGFNVNVQIQSQSRVGNVIINNASGGTITPQNDNNIGIKSTTYRNLNSDITAATHMSSSLAALPKTTTTAGWSTSDGGTTQSSLLGGSLNPGDNAHITLTDSTTTPLVFNLSTFNLNNGSVLTLSGSAADEIVFNISGGNLSVNNHSGIVLTGGLTPADVIYNNIGSGGGPNINNHSYVSGIVVATAQQVQVNNQSIVFGAVISDGLQLQNHSTIESPDN